MGLARATRHDDSPGRSDPVATQPGADDENCEERWPNYRQLFGIAARSMLSLSQEYVKADPSDAGLFDAPATLIRSVRNSAHYMILLVSGGSLLVLYTVLFRFALIPRALSAFGLATVALLIARGFEDRTAVPSELLREA